MIDYLKLTIEAEEIARAWVTATLNDEDDDGNDMEFFTDHILHPFMMKYGKEGGAAVCHSLVNVAAAIADIAGLKLGLRPQEVISQTVMED